MSDFSGFWCSFSLKRLQGIPHPPSRFIAEMLSGLVFFFNYESQILYLGENKMHFQQLF